MANLASLECKDAAGNVRVVIEAALGSRPKLDWGFVPSTLGDDGAPLDALVLDGQTWPGAVVPTVAIGALRVLQTERNQHQPERNERLIVVAVSAATAKALQPLSVAQQRMLEAFCVQAGEAHGKRVSVEGWETAAFATEAVTRANLAYEERND
jgi:inorganic pyrophosphatase